MSAETYTAEFPLLDHVTDGDGVYAAIDSVGDGALLDAACSVSRDWWIADQLDLAEDAEVSGAQVREWLRSMAVRLAEEADVQTVGDRAIAVVTVQPPDPVFDAAIVLQEAVE